jgi:superfamily I DNA/RNA helicase
MSPKLIFLSYARTDLEYSNRIRTDLVKNGSISVWRDLEDIRKNEGWDTEIEDILDSGKLSHFLFLETEQSCRKESVCRDEIDRAIQNQIPILRLLFQKAVKVPLRLQRKTYIDFTLDYGSALEQLLEEMAKVQSKPRSQAQPVSSLKPKNPTKPQITAAQDQTRFVRLVAPPGTGKSFVIEERVRHLLSQGVYAKSIFVVSFTRASSQELAQRIIRYCNANGYPNASLVNVSTLHSLALTLLRKKRQLDDYPVSPKVMDEWEIENIFDVEMGLEIFRGRSRCEEIRNAIEAYWCTGKWDIPPHMQPKEPVTQEEVEAFLKSLDPISQTYAVVLPGEIVKKCTDLILNGHLTPAPILDTRHLIVDEYQDLNYTDTQFIHSFSEYSSIFAAGDDDQSIYSFRHAYPLGIQQFLTEYPNASSHAVSICFRCTPKIISVATNLLSRFQEPNRILKQVSSIYDSSVVPIKGTVLNWIFRSEHREANGIANSCKKLIEKGIAPQDILILISNRKIQLVSNILKDAFEQSAVPIELSRVKPYIDSESGRFVFALIRVACDADLEDYIAHRTLLGLLNGVGNKTANGIRRKADNYLDLFYNPLPDKVFNTRETKAIERLKILIDELRSWSATDTLDQRLEEVSNILALNFSEDEVAKWKIEVGDLPLGMSLEELRQFLTTNRDDERITVLTSVYERLGLPQPSDGFFAPKVRVMTMHGVKGLEAQVVFIPGLEAGIIPNEKGRKSLYLRQEAARLLYVSITRAKSAVILSYATSRMIEGSRKSRQPSPFCTALGEFEHNDGNGLNTNELSEIKETIEKIRIMHQ